MTPSEFRAKFRPFTNTPDPVVQAALDEAESKCHPDSWSPSEFRDRGVALWAAHLLSLEPESRELRLTSEKTGVSMYLARFKELESSAGFGPVIV